MATQPVRPFLPSSLARDVREGLTHPRQKRLPPKYFYDEVGSALFEAICLLPEYGLTRADERILQRHSQDIVARLGPSVMVAELGSGSGKKTRLILEALGRRQMTPYFPIEISAAALEMCERENVDPLTANRAHIAVYVRELTSRPSCRASVPSGRSTV